MKLLRFALRSLLHFKLYTGINILGLALSLACVIIIFRYVHGEFTVDHYNPNIDRTYTTVVEHESDPGNIYVAGVPLQGRMPPERSPLSNPGVEMYSLFMIFENEEITVDERKFTVQAVAADSIFMAITDYPVLRGVANIDRVEDAFITEALGRRIFGDEDPLGKTFKHSSGRVLTVVGILGTPAGKSTIPFEMVINSNVSRMWMAPPYSIVRLYPHVDLVAFNDTYTEYEGDGDYKYRYHLFPLKDIYFSDIKADGFIRGNKATVIVLILVGIMLLCIGIVNFINIYTAVVLRRGREFGMKKVFGASGSRVFLQLFIENVVMILAALIVALALTELFNPVVRNILGFEQHASLGFNLLLSGGLLILIPLLTTLFPYLRFNYTAPIESLRSVGKTGGRSATRKIFLVLQYVVTLVMIMASLFFVRQLRVMINTDPGFRTTDIIQVPFYRIPTNFERYQTEDREKMREEQKKMRTNYEDIKKRMDESTLFSAWTYGQNPTKFTETMEFNAPDKEPQKVTLFQVSISWMNIFEIYPQAGKMWEAEKPVEASFSTGIYFLTYPEIVMTESAMKLFEFTDYTEARLESKDLPTHYKMELEPSSRSGEIVRAMEPVHEPFQVIGVVKDVHKDHLAKQGAPVVFIYGSSSQFFMPVIASIIPGKRQEAIEFLQQLQADTFGGDFEYSFVEDDVKAIYQDDRKIATIYSIFTLVAILISALGLYSMSLYDVQQRHKEIAIRKVNGATTGIIVGMLLKRYFYLLLLSFAISLPIVWLAIQRYLQGFAYKAVVPWWIFPVAFVITAGVSLLTLIWQTKKAADTNPATVIRKE